MMAVDTRQISNLLLTFESRIDATREEDRNLELRLQAVRNSLQRMVRLSPDEREMPDHLRQIERLIEKLHSRTSCNGDRQWAHQL